MTHKPSFQTEARSKSRTESATDWRDESIVVHGSSGSPTAAHAGGVEAAVHNSVAYRFESADDAASRFLGNATERIYSRWGHPNGIALEEKLARLECAEACVVFASGAAAIAGAFTASLKSGEHVVAQAGMYAETARFLREIASRWGIAVSFVDAIDHSAVRAALQANTKIVYIETPANPHLAIADIKTLSALAHTGGAQLWVDSTFATPYLQKPLLLGADVVLHSATKAISGHGDVLAGAVMGRGDRMSEVRKVGVRTMGAALAPAAAQLVERGLSTLAIRMERACDNAERIAGRLEQDDRVRRVHYPGLPSHPQHALAQEQMRRFGSTIAFSLANLNEAKLFYDTLKLITRAVSLGDVRSLITHPASTTSASLPKEQRIAAGIDDSLLRLSVGIEHIDDLWADIAQALDIACA